MKELIARKQIDNEELYFVLVEECCSDNNEPFTLFIQANHYSTNRVERAREFFSTLEDALEHCQRKYAIDPSEWQSEMRFTKSFQFDYGVTNQGMAQPYLVGFQNGQVIFRFGERKGDNDDTTTVLNICGNREGLRRLAAMLLLCAEGEHYDSFHIHLEDEESFILPDMPVTLRSLSYFETLIRDELCEGSATATIYPESKENAA